MCYEETFKSHIHPGSEQAFVEHTDVGAKRGSNLTLLWFDVVIFTTRLSEEIKSIYNEVINSYNT